MLDVLAERLDGRVRHVLLDEFQDTSRGQWAALEPFIAELLSQADGSEPSTLVVGDIKQAIYGWRGGCSAIMRDLPRTYHLLDNAVEDMHTSYRSSQAVLDAVDVVFNQSRRNRRGLL